MKRDWFGISFGFILLGMFAVVIWAALEDRKTSMKAEVTEHSGIGFVRSIDWYHRSLIFEADNGVQKPYWPLCDAQSIPVWQGEHCEFNFRWASGVSYTPERGTGCYAIDWVKHLPPDAR